MFVKKQTALEHFNKSIKNTGRGKVINKLKNFVNLFVFFLFFVVEYIKNVR